MQVDILNDGVYRVELTHQEDTVVTVVAQVTHVDKEEVIGSWLIDTILIHKNYDNPKANYEERGKNGD